MHFKNSRNKTANEMHWIDGIKYLNILTKFQDAFFFHLYFFYFLELKYMVDKNQVYTFKMLEMFYEIRIIFRKNQKFKINFFSQRNMYKIDKLC